MNELDLSQLMEEVMDTATEVLLKRKRVVPMLHFLKDGVMNLLPLPFGGTEQKDLMFFAAQKFLAQTKPEAAMFVSETWVVLIKKLKEGHKGPFNPKEVRKAAGLEGIEVLEHPDRKEHLLVVGAIDGSRQALSKEILRTPGGDPYMDEEKPLVMSHGVVFNKVFDGVFKPESEVGHC